MATKQPKPQPIVTRDSLQQLLDSADFIKRQRIIGRALMALLARQTAAEKALNQTSDDNGIGFASCDAKAGSLTAKYFDRTGTLVEWQIEKWMRPVNGYARICKYHKQLNEIAVARQQRTAPQFVEQRPLDIQPN